MRQSNTERAKKRHYYNRAVRRRASQIRQIQQALAFITNGMEWISPGQTSGDIDPGSLHLAVSGATDRVFERKDQPKGCDMAVGLLIDQSGSMMGPRIRKARETAIVLAEALDPMPGIALSIYGHTTKTTETEGDFREQVLLIEYQSPRRRSRESLLLMRAMRNNVDGYAISSVAKRLRQDYPNYARRIVIVIADGQPHGCEYRGDGAAKHVRRTCQVCKKRGVDVFCLAVDLPYGQEVGNEMYGKGNIVMLPKQELTCSHCDQTSSQNRYGCQGIECRIAPPEYAGGINSWTRTIVRFMRNLAEHKLERTCG